MADGDVLGGRYVLGEPLGRGGMAEVRRAQDLRLNRSVAVKVLGGDLARDPVFRKRFQREAQSAASLNHPTIVAVFDSGEETDPGTGAQVPYIVMELIEGKTLGAVTRGGHQLPPQRALEITQGVLDALAHSHDAGIIHRDIKPGNVMLTPAGDVKVMDFGIARAVADTSSDLTSTATVIGTAHYLSPEQARGERVDVRSDIYSTGCLLYELLTGRPPFLGESAISVVYQHVREAPAPPSQHSPLVHPRVEAITLKALAKEPADRYQTAREMREDITRVLTGEPAASAGAGPAEESPTATIAQPLAAAALAAPAVIPADATAAAPAVGPVVGPPVGPVVAAAAPVEPGPDPDARRRRPVVLLVASLVLLLVAGGGFALYRAVRSPDPGAALVGVPNVVGSTRAQAEAVLRGAGLTAKVTEVSGAADDTVGTVVKQSPVTGREVAASTVVTLTVNAGAKKVAIPDDLVGQDVAAAEQALRSAGFSEVRTREADEDDVDGADPGEVTAVDPKPGSKVALDERITLSYVEEKEAEPTATRSTEPAPSDDDESEEPEESEEPKETEQPSASADPTATREPTRSASASATQQPTTTPTSEPTTSTTEPSATSTPTRGKPTKTPKARSTARAKTPKARSTARAETPAPPQPAPSADSALAADGGQD